MLLKKGEQTISPQTIKKAVEKAVQKAVEKAVQCRRKGRSERPSKRPSKKPHVRISCKKANGHCHVETHAIQATKLASMVPGSNLARTSTFLLSLEKSDIQDMFVEL